MTGFQNPYMNPYGFAQPYQNQITQPQQQVTKVNGENGAKAYQIGVNSSALLLDESGLLIWLVTSDGAGYKTVTAYDIKPHQEAPKPDYGSLENRIQRLEEIVNGNARNTATDSKIKPNDGTNQTDGRYGERIAKPTSYDEPVAYKQPEYETGNGSDQSFGRRS